MRFIIPLLFITSLSFGQWTPYNVNMEVKGKFQADKQVYFRLGADSGKVWKCVNDSTGLGQWSYISSSSIDTSTLPYYHDITQINDTTVSFNKLTGQKDTIEFLTDGINVNLFNKDSVEKYAWSLTGNSGTNPATNFIGTTDAKDLVFKTNGIQRAIIDGGGGFFNTVDSNGSQIYTGYQVVNFGFGDVYLPSAKCVITKNAVKYTAGVETIPLGTPWTQSVLGAIDTTNFSGFIARAEQDSFTIDYNYPDGSHVPAQLFLNRQSFGIRSKAFGADTGQNFIMQYGTNDGNVGIGTDLPTAKLQVNGSLKYIDGTQANGKVLTSDASGLASWQTLALTDTATLDFPSVSANNQQILTVTVTGAALSDVVSLGIPNATINTNKIAFNAWVSATDTVSVKCFNFDGGSIDPVAGLFTVKVFK